MIELRPFYQFGFFIPHGLTANTDVISKLVNDFKGFKLLPSTINKIQIGPDQNILNGLQLQLISEDKDLIIDFEPNRYLIQKFNTNNNPLPSFDEFTLISKEIIDILKSSVDLKASRMSFVTKGLCKIMKSDELAYIHGNIFKLPKRFSGNETPEWNTRQVCREKHVINGKDELINIIMDISRIQGLLKQKENNIPIDRIEIGFDLNTFQGNLGQRFDSSDVPLFLKEMKKILDELEDDLKGLFYE